jgi:hypothetical protein
MHLRRRVRNAPGLILTRRQWFDSFNSSQSPGVARYTAIIISKKNAAFPDKKRGSFPAPGLEISYAIGLAMSPQSSGAGARSPGGDSGASRSARCWRTNPRRGARRRPATTYGQLHRVAARLPRRRGAAVGYTGDDGDAGQARDGELARSALGRDWFPGQSILARIAAPWLSWARLV